jgi:alcohol dehydrogenase class IV
LGELVATKDRHLTRNDLRELRKFVAPEVVFGAGARRLAGQYARNLGAQQVLLVTDAGVIGAGWASEVEASLEHAGVGYSLFSRLSPNPRAQKIKAGAEQ